MNEDCIYVLTESSGGTCYALGRMIPARAASRFTFSFLSYLKFLSHLFTFNISPQTVHMKM
jgi:hypothetical protein